MSLTKTIKAELLQHPLLVELERLSERDILELGDAEDLCVPLAVEDVDRVGETLSS